VQAHTEAAVRAAERIGRGDPAHRQRPQQAGALAGCHGFVDRGPAPVLDAAAAGQL
jgi:hypothetical protein